MSRSFVSRFLQPQSHRLTRAWRTGAVPSAMVISPELSGNVAGISTYVLRSPDVHVTGRVMGTSEPALKERLAAAKALVKLFWLERYTYLALSAFFGVVAAIALIKLIFYGPEDWYKTVLPAFGSSGIISLVASQVLRVFNRTFDAVMGPDGKAVHEIKK